MQLSDAGVEILLLPYAGAAKRTLLHVLVEEFSSGNWSHFRGAVAFASASGNYPELMDAMADFAAGGRVIEMTFGADSFGVDMQGTESAAIEELLERFKDLPSIRIFVYHEGGRTFHPKLYLFSNEPKQEALLIMGSSNWSYGGLVRNVEADVAIRLSLTEPDHRQCFDTIVECFENFWQEPIA